MCLCLESQFDSVIPDRPLIICRIQLLTAILPDEEILSWDFFIQRFESLALESQLRGQTENSFVHGKHFKSLVFTLNDSSVSLEINFLLFCIFVLLKIFIMERGKKIFV